jgi:1-aminocyclopropane-1-carboxylate deaminase
MKVLGLMKLPSPLEKLTLQVAADAGVNLYVKRDDLIHPVISGNKWRKLKYNLTQCLSENKKGIITFGGSHSNHLSATAYLCQQERLSCKLIVRGERARELSDTLTFCESSGAELIFESRENYRNKSNPAYMLELANKYPEYFIIPEGGANEFGIQGAAEIISEITIPFDFITVDCGTGATLSGMVKSLQPHQKAIGIQVLKADDFISAEVRKDYPDAENFEVWTDYHFGGYAKYKPELIDFMRWFYQETNIKLDPIYTGKQFYAVIDQLKKGCFPEGSTIILTHTGGLQGIPGFEKRYGVRVY